jgi:phage-related minor tail protein
MGKSWKDLFIKSDDPEQNESASSSDNFSFPVNNNIQSTANNSMQPNQGSGFVQSEAVKEVLQVYEKGLDSINMPGYDFYEFYRTIVAAGINSGEQVYNMAFQMAKGLDNTVSSAKLLTDAEFYISKLNDVHSQYSSQGQQKLTTIQNNKGADKSKLTSEIDAANRRISDLKNELQTLEASIRSKQDALTKVDNTYVPQEQIVNEKLQANDMAHAESISKLNRVKDGIKQFVKY